MAGQVWGVAAEGGYLYSDNLSNYLRVQLLEVVKFRQLCDIKESDKDGNTLLGKHKGETWTWNRFSKLATKGGALVETTKMPESGFTITQNSGTITEYGNSVPYTGKLDDLSEQPVREIIRKLLRIDAKEALDVAAHAKFNATPLRVAPSSGTSTTAVTLTTNGATATTNGVAFRNSHVQPIVDIMKERNIPGYEGDDYLAIGWPTTFSTLKDDLESIHQYVETGLMQLKNGETGRYRGVRFIEQTHIPKGGANDSTAWDAQEGVADPWNGGLSDWIFFMGDDTVAEGIACPEEIRGKIPGDYGRDHGVAWYALEGFGLTHPDAANARIIKWDSAA